MNIPDYPKFRHLELSDKAEFDSAFKAHPPENSEYTFTNLYSWKDAHDFRASKLEGSILLEAKQAGRDVYYPPIGGKQPQAVIKKVLMETAGSRFVRVPESVKSLFEGDESVHSADDRANADYIYPAQDLIKLEGRKYDGKRNLIKNFRSKHQYEYVQVAKDTVPEILRFQDIWCVEKGCGQSKSLQDESEAVRVMLKHLDMFGLKAGAIRCSGKISAVCIAEALNPLTIVIHVLKGTQSMTGIYQTVYNEFLTREAGGFKFVNMEQDLGIEGLRKAKESYHPVRLLKKFSLSYTGEKAKI